jgi:hypothetical protein
MSIGEVQSSKGELCPNMPHIFRNPGSVQPGRSRQNKSPGKSGSECNRVFDVCERQANPWLSENKD